MESDPLMKTAREVPGPGSYQGNYRVGTRADPKTIIGTAARDKNTFYDT
jgi:hypothetical protein